MKKFLVGIILLISLGARSQNFGTVDSLRTYTNIYIRNSAINAFTNLRLNTAMNAICNFLDSARLSWGGGGGGAADGNNYASTLDLTSGVLTLGRTGLSSLTTNVTTTHVTEGSNLYFTNARSRSALSAGLAITYNSTTGVIAADTATLFGYIPYLSWENKAGFDSLAWLKSATEVRVKGLAITAGSNITVTPTKTDSTVSYQITSTGGSSALTQKRVGYGDGSNLLDATGSAAFLFDPSSKTFTVDSNTFTKNRIHMMGDPTSQAPTLISMRRNFSGSHISVGGMGMLGTHEFNLFNNMDYYTHPNDHRYYDSTLGMEWMYVDSTGFGWQATQSRLSNQSDVWVQAGSPIPFKVDFMQDANAVYRTGMNKIYTAQINLYDQTLYSQAAQVFVNNSIGQMTGIRQWQYENTENNTNSWILYYRKNKLGNWTIGAGTAVVEYNYNGSTSKYLVQGTATVNGGFSNIEHLWKTTNTAGSVINAFLINQDGNIGIKQATAAYSIDINATDGIKIPVGTTAQRPTGAAGVIRVNSDSTNKVEYYNGSAWASLGSSAGGSTTLEQAITNGNTLTADRSIDVQAHILQFISGTSGDTELQLYNDQGNTKSNFLDFRKLVSGGYNLGGSVTAVKMVFNTMSQLYWLSSANTFSGLSTIDMRYNSTNAAGSTADRWTMTAEGDMTLPTGGITSIKTRGATSSDIGLFIQDNSSNAIFKVTGDKGITVNVGSDANYDLHYRNTSGTLSRLANGTTGQVLKATTSAAPSWGSPSIVTAWDLHRADSTNTTNATPATLTTYTINDNSSGVLTIDMAGIQTSASGAITGKKVVRYKKLGSTLTLGSITSILADEVDAAVAGATWTITTSSNNIIIQVTGVAATSIDWKVVCTFTSHTVFP